MRPSLSDIAWQLARRMRDTSERWFRVPYDGLQLRDARLNVQLSRTRRAHAGLVAAARSARTGSFENRVVILPPDPVLLTASRGDQAMLAATLRAIEERLPGAEVYVFTVSDRADEAARTLSMVPLRVPALDRLEECFDVIMSLRPRQVVLLGADGMDGAHDPNFSFSLLALADLAAHAGIPATITGFSLSCDVDERVAAHFARAHEALSIYVRDPASLTRFHAFCPDRGSLVADVAFGLHPSTELGRSKEVVEWIDRRRAAGDLVIGLNVHPLLYRDVDQEAVAEHLQRFASTLVSKLQRGHKLSVLLVAHDFRDASADVNCHQVIAPWLAKHLGERYHDLCEPLPAWEIKGAIGHLDGVITGRMHLAIAALGQGVPVLGLNYRDKMDGLAELFDQRHCVVSTADYLAVDPVIAVADAFLREIERNRATVRAKLPEVLRMSARNFEHMVSASVLLPS